MKKAQGGRFRFRNQATGQLRAGMTRPRRLPEALSNCCGWTVSSTEQPGECRPLTGDSKRSQPS